MLYLQLNNKSYLIKDVGESKLYMIDEDNHFRLPISYTLKRNICILITNIISIGYISINNFVSIIKIV